MRSVSPALMELSVFAVSPCSVMLFPARIAAGREEVTVSFECTSAVSMNVNRSIFCPAACAVVRLYSSASRLYASIFVFSVSRMMRYCASHAACAGSPCAGRGDDMDATPSSLKMGSS